MQLLLRSEAVFCRGCVTIRPLIGFPRLAPSAIRRSGFKENGYILLRLVLALIALTAFLIPFGSPIKTQAALQDPKAIPPASPQGTPQDTKKDAKPQEPKP